MAFPWGGKVTTSQLAARFGWSRIILSWIFLPPLVLFAKLVAFPFWLEYIWENGPLYMSRTEIRYPESPDLYRREVFFSEKSPFRYFSGWDVLVDREGGKFFESFFGIIHCLECDITEDRFILTPSFWTFIVVKVVYVEFDKDQGNRIRFYFPMKGPNLINPFSWIFGMCANAALTVLFFWGDFPLTKPNNVRKKISIFPPAEDESKMRPDGSLPFFDEDESKKKDD